jgi:hypothetical protein
MIKAFSSFIVLGLMAASFAQAKDVPISFESQAYPSPAADHLDQTQSALAQEAISACGGRKNVVGITAFQITVTESVTSPVAPLAAAAANTDPSLDLWYPIIKAKAVARCKD